MPATCKSVSSHKTKSKNRPRRNKSDEPHSGAAARNDDFSQATEALPLSALEVRGIYVALYEGFVSVFQHRKVTWKRNARWDGGRLGKLIYQPIWPSIAACIDSQNLPYFEFLRQKFFFCSRTPPMPVAMLTDIGAETLRSSLEQATEEARYQLRYQMDFHEMICRHPSWDYLSHVPGQELISRPSDNRSFLLMYCVTMQVEDESKASWYRADAFKQYRRCPYAYNLAWKEILPKNIYYDALASAGIKLPPALDQQPSTEPAAECVHNG